MKIDSSDTVKINRKIGKTSDIYSISNLGEKKNSAVIATKENNKEHQYVFSDRYLKQQETAATVAEIKKVYCKYLLASRFYFNLLKQCFYSHLLQSTGFLGSEALSCLSCSIYC